MSIFLCTEHGRNIAASQGVIKHCPVTTSNKIHQQVNGPVALLKLKIRSFIPVNLLRGTNQFLGESCPAETAEFIAWVSV